MFYQFVTEMNGGGYFTEWNRTLGKHGKAQ